ncbi:homeobox-leucine zipper protein HOX11-like [Ipomoea triloba]|uniref:homeobox-leucine zipper protein HOX11-like n=1 Tax=Ipomoea triloba TaxID=35885 RepID=UPI00125D9CD4|nr:homeobox-leucine zipper protein HOX11-like [Ipomoea triloba]
MELGLSVGGDSSSIPTLKPFSFLEISSASAYDEDQKNGRGKDNNIGFCMGSLGDGGGEEEEEEEAESGSPVDEEPPLQLALLPLSPPPLPCAAAQPRFPWLSHNLGSEPGLLSNLLAGKGRGSGGGAAEAASGASSFPARWWSRKRDMEGDMMRERGGSSNNNNSVGSDEIEDEIINGGLGRKKLRLTRQQSAFLEQTFKQHSTLNPKNKAALAKQLNLRPRQVEVWFQNRRARTKLKQTEVDCEYLRRCCDTLREENKRLQKELQELRALKKSTTSHLFYNHLPATTLNICPSCTRTATTTPSAATNTALSLPKSEC